MRCWLLHLHRTSNWGGEGWHSLRSGGVVCAVAPTSQCNPPVQLLHFFTQLIYASEVQALLGHHPSNRNISLWAQSCAFCLRIQSISGTSYCNWRRRSLDSTPSPREPHIGIVASPCPLDLCSHDNCKQCMVLFLVVNQRIVSMTSCVSVYSLCVLCHAARREEHPARRRREPRL